MEAETKVIKGNSFITNPFHSKNIEQKCFTPQKKIIFNACAHNYISPQTPVKILWGNTIS